MYGNIIYHKRKKILRYIGLCWKPSLPLGVSQGMQPFYRENCFQNIVKKEVIYLSELAIGIESEFYLMVKVEFFLI